ncbi:hypothetical protein PF008_g31535 [Phytophthora fragariae]|uniref:Uncharacterized protein n=1 Tax=Phytophthora fragariae TaxID=53985 RepID=A0A6G0Q2H2_9STRA|nr:hypothetical protein PF008_g31535 [Phytophthora fragariae]
MTTEEVQERRQERLKLIKAQIEQISDDETSTKRLTHFERQRRQIVLYKERLVRGRVLTASEKKERRARKFQQEFERSTAAVELLSDGEDKQKALRKLEKSTMKRDRQKERRNRGRTLTKQDIDERRDQRYEERT